MTLVTIFGTPVRAKAAALYVSLGLWAGVTWLGLRRHPQRRVGKGLLIGLAETILLLLTDFGHPIGHILSARLAGAPMDEVLIAPPNMPRTLYWDNDVSPNTHRLRALGGPIYNLLGLLLSTAVFQSSPSGSTGREISGWSALGHGAILAMSLAPVSVVDGGTILKWTLVARGRTPTEADQVVRRVEGGMAIAAGAAGAGLVAARRPILGLVLLGMGAAVAGVAAGKIR